jgi:hypothetical protein
VKPPIRPRTSLPPKSAFAGFRFPADTTFFIPANNPIESDHSQLKHRLRPMRGLRTDRTTAGDHRWACLHPEHPTRTLAARWCSQGGTATSSSAVPRPTAMSTSAVWPLTVGLWRTICRRTTRGPTLIWNNRHLQRVLTGYLKHYNTGRPHRGIGLEVPVPIGVLTAVETSTDPDARVERVLRRNSRPGSGVTARPASRSLIVPGRTARYCTRPGATNITNRVAQPDRLSGTALPRSAVPNDEVGIPGMASFGRSRPSRQASALVSTFKQDHLSARGPPGRYFFSPIHRRRADV